MKKIFKPGDKKIYRTVVTAGDLATFHGQNVHAVCSTFSLARDFEWASRLFFLEMKDDDEEGVGTFLSLEHKSPAFEKEELIFTATVVKIHGHELTCTVQAQVGDRIVATGSTGQKMFSKKRLNEIFAHD